MRIYWIRAFAACLLISMLTAFAADAEPPSQPVEFDGRTHGVTLEADERLASEAGITLAAWVRLDSHQPPQIIMNRGRRGEYVTLYLWQEGLRMLVQHRDDAYTQAVAGTDQLGEPGDWLHVLGTYDGRDIVLYVNGEEINRTRAEGRLRDGDAPLHVGTQAEGLNPLHGALADVRVWDTPLDAEQAAAVARGETIAEASLVVGLDGDDLAAAQQSHEPFAGRIAGYRLIWFDLGQRSAYGSKYSGALGTYTAKHHPLAVYAEEVDKTFFVYGGTPAADQRHLLAMIGYYDHATGEVAQPTIVMDKQGVDDPHDNPSLQIDGDGHLWVFVSGRGRGRPGMTYRSEEPFSIEAFEHVREAEYTYPQPWHVEGEGFVKMFTKYTDGRELYWSTSEGGREWSEDRKLAGMGGHYQVSNERDGRVITAFNMHPGGNVDRRTNLYYVESDDMGQTWRTAAGEQVATPMEDADSPALVRDYRSMGRLVYVKDINFDADGRPVVLYVSSTNFRPGPIGEPRWWTVAHWTGEEWAIHKITRAWHNYDMGSLYVDEGVWRVIAPTEPGPQRWGTGGEVAVWLSEDAGRTWRMDREVTADSEYNHAYVRRPVNAHPDFYGFWADGSPDELTRSKLYFTNREGDVWRLPYEMAEEYEAPQRVHYPIPGE